MSNKIRHVGVVETITEDCVRVRVTQTSACSACKLASHCSASEQKEKLIDIFDQRSISGRSVGENVIVSTSIQVGMRAVMVGFVFPFIVLVATLVVVLQLTGDEGVAALSGILSLIPCYVVIWLLRDRMRRRFTFVIDD